MEMILLETMLGQSTNTLAGNPLVGAGEFVLGNLGWIVLGIVLIVATIAIIYLVKRVVVNSVIGLIGWLLITFGLPMLGIEITLPFVPSLVVSAVFGLAGLGVMIILAVLGII